MKSAMQKEIDTYSDQVKRFEAVQIKRDHCGSCKATTHKPCHDKIIADGKIPLMTKCTDKRIATDNQVIHRKCIHPRGSKSGVSLSVYKYAKGFLDGAKAQQKEDLKPMAALVKKAQDREQMKAELEEYVLVLNRIMRILENDPVDMGQRIQDTIKEVIE